MFSKSAFTGTRVFLKSQAPLTFPGMRSTARHWLQSSMGIKWCTAAANASQGEVPAKPAAGACLGGSSILPLNSIESMTFTIDRSRKSSWYTRGTQIKRELYRLPDEHLYAIVPAQA